MKNNLFILIVIFALSGCTQDVVEPNYIGKYYCRTKTQSQMPGSAFHSGESIDSLEITRDQDQFYMNHFHAGFIPKEYSFTIDSNRFFYNDGGRSRALGYFVNDSLYYDKNYQGPGGSSYFSSESCRCVKK